MSITPDLLTIGPELILAIGAMAFLMVGVFRNEDSFDLISTLSLLLLAAAGAVLVFGGQGGETAFGGQFINDTFAKFMKALTLFGSAVTIMMSVSFMKRRGIQRFEYPVLVVLATLGMCMMISANDLVSLYMGLELQSLALYVVAAINRDSIRSSEAGLKYFVLGALSSGMLLYGASLVYGFTGATQFEMIATAAGTGHAGLGLLFGIVFLVAGMAFKVSAVPFHMWTPDVYEGAPTPVTAFFAAAPKVAAMAIFTRLLIDAFPGVTQDWQQIVVFISIASMVLGAFAAIGQDNIKRLLAYSSIGHMGFALVGLAAGTAEGVRGVIIYMAIYMIMTLGTFACVIAMRTKDEGQVESISDLAGLARNDKFMAFVLALLMFSLAGIPPLAGFFGKLFVFMAAIKEGLLALTIIGVLTSVVGAFYYLRIVKIMYLDEPEHEFEGAPREIKLVIGLAGLFVLAFVAYPNLLIAAAEAAAASLF